MKNWIKGAIAASLVSVAGVTAIATHEGLRYNAYPDPATGGAPWTICYGHTGNDVYPGLKADMKQCKLWLAKDIAVAETYLQKYVKVPLTQGEYDAYTSFIFNAGPANFRTSSMLRLLNAGNRRAACNQFPRWVYANKKKMNGLVERRFEEQATCLKFGAYIYVPST